LNAVHTRCGRVQIHDQQKQLAAVSAELQASQEQAERQQKELDRANRSAQQPRLCLQQQQPAPSTSMPALAPLTGCKSACAAVGRHGAPVKAVRSQTTEFTCFSGVLLPCRLLEIRISELSEEFGGSSDVPAQLLHSLAGGQS
jgi:hypothetical protein